MNGTVDQFTALYVSHFFILTRSRQDQNEQWVLRNTGDAIFM